MRIEEIKMDKKRFLELLLLADEQENMIDRYLEDGRMFVLYDEEPKCEAVVIERSKTECELKNLATDPTHQGKGYGKAMMGFWEKEMQQRGHKMLLTSTQVDEEAQHFYRKLGYQDAGSLLITVPEYQQPMELFLLKRIAVK